jgi:hypothetical protein
MKLQESEVTSHKAAREQERSRKRGQSKLLTLPIQSLCVLVINFAHLSICRKGQTEVFGVRTSYFKRIWVTCHLPRTGAPCAHRRSQIAFCSAREETNPHLIANRRSHFAPPPETKNQLTCSGIATSQIARRCSSAAIFGPLAQPGTTSAQPEKNARSTP